MTRFSRTGWLTLALSLGAHGVFAIALQERMGQPAITSITPAGRVDEKAPRTLTIAGRDFSDGLALEVTSPEGQTQVLSGQEIRDLKENAFQISLLLNRAGTYTFLVRNPNGSASNVFQYKVAPVPVTPAIERIDPMSVTRDTRPQRFTVIGRNFETGLTVTVTSPAGDVTTIARDDIGTVTPTSLTVDLTLIMAGDYSLFVTNPSTTVSNSVTIAASQPLGFPVPLRPSPPGVW